MLRVLGRPSDDNILIADLDFRTFRGESLEVHRLVDDGSQRLERIQYWTKPGTKPNEMEKRIRNAVNRK